jgi:hypothetical protein
MKIIVFLWTLAALVISGRWLFFSEPRARGHSLSTWLELSGQVGSDLSVEDAQAALNEIGDRALPTLLQKIQARDPSWKEPVHRLWPEVPFLPVPFSWASDEQQQGMRGFAWLGPKGQAAIPELTKLLYGTNAAYNAGYALGYIGEEALPVLRGALTNATNSKVQLIAVNASSASSKIAVATLPEIRILRTSSNEPVAACAVLHLMRHAAREESDAAAVDALQSRRPMVRMYALNNLTRANIDSNKSAAVLVQLLNDSDPVFRRRLTNTLRHINPTIAASAGIPTNPPRQPPGHRGTRRGCPSPPNGPAQL